MYVRPWPAAVSMVIVFHSYTSYVSFMWFCIASPSRLVSSPAMSREESKIFTSVSGAGLCSDRRTECEPTYFGCEGKVPTECQTDAVSRRARCSPILVGLSILLIDCGRSHV